MLLSTRDAQRERRSSLFLAAASIASRPSSNAFDNASFRTDSIPDFMSANILSKVQPHAQIHPPHSPTLNEIIEQTPTTDEEKPPLFVEKKRFKWRMRHYFYMHMGFFIMTGLLGGLIVWLIENYSSARNQQMNVAYIDAWFVSSSCVSSCGLTTLDFANLSRASQIVLMFFTFISGITISTLPALAVKAYTHKRIEGITVDDDHGEVEEEHDDELPTFNVRHETNLPEHIREKIAKLPTTAQLRYRAYITTIFITLGTCFTIYAIVFFAIGGWLATRYTSNQLLQGNTTVDPWFISFIVTVTGFNQNGLSPFSDGLARFVNDVYINMFVIMIVACGTSLFPFILRYVVILMRHVSPWRHKILFDYILLNNHRLSTLLFPAVQTRIYLFVTMLLYLMGVGISLILDFRRDAFIIYTPGIRFLIFLFHTVNTRFAGFQTVDINNFAAATLLIYLLLMATKPQMLCAIDESPFELSWLAVQARDEVDARTSSAINLAENENLPGRMRSGSISSDGTGAGGLRIRPMERFLRRQSLVTKDLARERYNNVFTIDGEQSKLKSLRILRMRLFVIYFVRVLLKHTVSFIILTRTWLFFFIFLICAIEYRRMAPVDPNITIFKIIFEIISAFGTVGLTLGYPNIASSFSTVLSPASKIILILTMLMGRHRGLLASMKDQEEIEHNASDLLNRYRKELIYKHETSPHNTESVNETRLDDEIVRL